MRWSIDPDTHSSHPAQRSACRQPGIRSRRVRRGSALILTLVLTLSLASVATAAIYVASNASLIATSYDRERDLRYAAEATLAMGKSTLNFDPYASPDSGYRQVHRHLAILGADGQPIQGITTTMYVGPTSSNTGQFGRFVSVVAIAQNDAGATVVRRLELAQESFAKFAYWSNQESNNGNPIYFNNNDQLWGPVWSNDQINIGSGGARFHGDVGTARTINGIGYGTFDRGYAQHQKAIQLPNSAQLASLAGYAAAGGFSFNTVNAPAVSGAVMRIEFVARPFNNGVAGSTALNGVDDGFFRVYVSRAGAAWLRGDYSTDNCGASYVFRSSGTGPGTAASPLFVPLSEHTRAWFRNALLAAGYGSTFVNSMTSSNAATLKANVLGQASARCHLGGDPNLRAVNLRGTAQYSAAVALGGTRPAGDPAWINVALALGGSDTTFDAGASTWSQGYWVAYPGTVDPRITSMFGSEGAYLFPLYRGLNPGTRGVIYVNGTVGISGKLRGRVTVYAAGSIAVLRDVKYVTDPSLGLCQDVLGVIAGHDIMIADNALQTPVNIAPSGSNYRNMDDTRDVFVQGIMMALSTAFGAENYANGPNASSPGNGCEGAPNGRGCLYLTGGIIQQQRGAVGLSSGEGFTKRYSYDSCALYNPPPYFPTTGRYTENRYYEMDPSGFDVAAMYRALTPGP